MNFQKTLYIFLCAFLLNLIGKVSAQCSDNNDFVWKNKITCSLVAGKSNQKRKKLCKKTKIQKQCRDTCGKCSTENSSSTSNSCLDVLKDDKSFSMNSDPSKTCRWMKTSGKRSKFCLKENVVSNCAKTCYFDDPEYTFTLDNGLSKKCAWLSKDFRREDYCDRSFDGVKVKDMCRKSCKPDCFATPAPSVPDIPVGDGRNLTAPPTKSPSPTAFPSSSFAPTESPTVTMSPTVSCDVVANLRFPRVDSTVLDQVQEIPNAADKTFLLTVIPDVQMWADEFGKSIFDDTAFGILTIEVNGRKKKTYKYNYDLYDVVEYDENEVSDVPRVKISCSENCRCSFNKM
ncbi:predicted protein [Chaetoceros tenuissimus]|uniref:ShKT domain-containing protein n=1 Tax=Chaetoceros tenuissimus TaxID=426638 RepID=A0AAD3GZA2_9STRA|nr:predicted protein [Chaetoceros tenuissimus]